METEILGFGIQNSAQEIRKIPLTIFYWDPLFQIPQSRSPESSTHFQNPRLSWITLHGQVIECHWCSYLGGYSCVVLNELIFCAVFTAFVHITRDVWCCTLKLGCPRDKDHTGYLESTGYDHKGASQEEKSFLP